jgi:hypothetical protein
MGLVSLVIHRCPTKWGKHRYKGPPSFVCTSFVSTVRLSCLKVSLLKFRPYPNSLPSVQNCWRQRLAKVSWQSPKLDVGNKRSLRSSLGWTFDQVAKVIGKDEVWVAAAFYAQVCPARHSQTSTNSSQAKFTAEELRKVSEALGVPSAEALSEIGDHWWPNRGIGPSPPTDPVLYRLYEV